jgi:hypothetical protein
VGENGPGWVVGRGDRDEAGGVLGRDVEQRSLVGGSGAWG